MFTLVAVKNLLLTYGAKKVLDSSFNAIKKTLGRLNKEKSVFRIESLDLDDSIDFIAKHIHDNLNWASNVSFRAISNNPKSLLDVFVDLDLYLTPLKLHVGDEKTDRTPSSDLLHKDSVKVILLGQPGAGKTTTVKKLFIELFHGRNKSPEGHSFPLIIQLKNLNRTAVSRYSLLEEIFSMVGVKISEIKVPEGEVDAVVEYIYGSFIDQLNPYFIFDGFDEISDQLMKGVVIDNIRKLSSKTNCSFVLTSRSADFNYHIDNVNEFEICSLDEDQVLEFISKWFNETEYSKTSNFDPSDLIQKLKNSPYWDTALRPLTLAHLCALQERNNSIPDRPKTIYKQIVDLLLEDWNNQRSIVRTTSYSNFTIQRKSDFLARLAFELSVEYQDSKFNTQLLSVVYNEICHDFELPKDQVKEVVKELESHSGLIVETSFDNYEFAHKSIQEYLTADFITKQSDLLNDNETLSIIPNEVAIYIALSSFPNYSLHKVVQNLSLEGSIDIEFVLPLINRLLIEKPDFSRDALYAISVVNLMNIIVSHLHDLRKDPVTFSDSIESRYTMCLGLLMQFDIHLVFNNSVSKLKDYYTISSVEISGGARFSLLKQFGATWLLRRNVRKFKLRKLLVDIPDTLILPGNLYTHSIVR